MVDSSVAAKLKGFVPALVCACVRACACVRVCVCVCVCARACVCVQWLKVKGEVCEQWGVDVGVGCVGVAPCSISDLSTSTKLDY
jgi:hypothetical protein